MSLNGTHFWHDTLQYWNGKAIAFACCEFAFKPVGHGLKPHRQSRCADHAMFKMWCGVVVVQTEAWFALFASLRSCRGCLRVRAPVGFPSIPGSTPLLAHKQVLKFTLARTANSVTPVERNCSAVCRAPAASVAVKVSNAVISAASKRMIGAALCSAAV